MLCPYCQHHFVVSDQNHDDVHGKLFKRDESTFIKIFRLLHSVCPNPDCKKSILAINLSYLDEFGGRKEILTRKLMPDSISKNYPDYIPFQLREDYEEACKIVDLSPKAAATLARRCLQGIIRDYFGITKGRLVDEINDLQGKIDLDLWNAIDGLRKVGNIGAHMEKDVNLMISIDPNEARLLIKLIEILFDSLYVQREERRKQLKAIQELATDKDAQKKGLPASPDVGDSLLTP